MAKQLFLLVATLLLLASPWPALSTEAPPSNSSSSPAPSSRDCNTVVIDMMSCLDYVQRLGSEKTKPDSSDCCHRLEEVVRLSPTCLCEGLNTASDLGYAVSTTRAAELSPACNVKLVPGFGNCRASTRLGYAATVLESDYATIPANCKGGCVYPKKCDTDCKASGFGYGRCWGAFRDPPQAKYCCCNLHE